MGLQKRCVSFSYKDVLSHSKLGPHTSASSRCGAVELNHSIGLFVFLSRPALSHSSEALRERCVRCV